MVSMILYIAYLVVCFMIAMLLIRYTIYAVIFTSYGMWQIIRWTVRLPFLPMVWLLEKVHNKFGNVGLVIVTIAAIILGVAAGDFLLLGPPY